MAEPTDKNTESLIEQLLHGMEISDRRNAAINLCKIKSQKAIEALIQSLGDHEDVAIFSMLALLEIGAEVIPNLRNALKSLNEQIRGYSTEILGELHAEEALDDMLNIVENDESSWVRNTAVEAIQMFDNEKVVPILEKLSESPDNWLVASSSVALFRLKNDKSLIDKLLNRIAHQNEDERNMTAWALIEIVDKDDLPKLQKLLDETTDNKIKVLINEIVRAINSR